MFVTPAERQEYNPKNETISNIKDLITNTIATIQDPSARDTFEEEYGALVNRKGKKPIKQDFLDFYALVVEYCEYTLCASTWC